MRSIADWISHWAETRPDAVAYRTADEVWSWRDYDRRSDAIGAHLLVADHAPGDRVAVLLPDGPEVHAAFAGCEKAGCIAVGIGPRAGYQEIAHLLEKTGARSILAEPSHQERDLHAFARELGVAPVDLRATRLGAAPPPPDRRPGPEDVFLLNSTSGTTGMPKVVVHDQARWLAFHELAVETGKLSADDVFMSVVPAPFGFGIWTSHVTPTRLGAPTVLAPRFDAEETLALIERHRVSVLAAVSTQFILLLESPAFAETDWSSLRALYTGGEAVPFERAAAFEEQTGAAVLQFYGSNETGAVSGTRLDDPREKRLRSAGRPIPAMQLRLFDESGREVTETGRGQPGVKGPTLSRGYWDDDVENDRLVRADGWMLLGDIVTLDDDGYLFVVGRSDDFIIRGGKNISGPAVEEQVATHPAVALAAAVAMPDPVFGERVCVFVELRPGEALDLEALVSHLRDRQVSKESWPERLEVVDALPRGSGGKVAKQQLREAIRAKLAAEDRSRPPE